MKYLSHFIRSQPYQGGDEMVQNMNFELPSDLQQFISKLDKFITSEILPVQKQNIQFFDHRREPSRTQWDNNGLPTPEWEALLSRARKLADDAGFYRFPLPEPYGGQNGSNLAMCALRYHMASHPAYGGGVSLANDLQNEHSVIGNFPDFLMLYHWGNEQQKDEFIPARLQGRFRWFAPSFPPSQYEELPKLIQPSQYRHDIWPDGDPSRQRRNPYGYQGYAVRLV